MHWIDWLIIIIPLVVITIVSFNVQKHVKGVSDFLAGGRIAGRYLLAVAGAEAGFGLISVIAVFEMYYKSGFALFYWQNLSIPVGLFLTLTGFAIYRYRETRVMTMAQFFEIRYSKGFRIFAGFVAFLSGVVNYALFPAVGGRFLMYYCGLPDYIVLLEYRVSTFGIIMAIALLIAVVMIWCGGQLTTMVMDCLQGIFSYIAYSVITIFIICFFSFRQFGDVMLARSEGQSFVNPFNIDKLTDFNVLFVLIGIFSTIYNRISWQGTQGFNCAAATPHEQKMAGVLGTWRSGFSFLMIMLLTIGAYTYLNHPDFAQQAGQVTQELQSKINLGDPLTTETIRSQMKISIALKHMFPVGIVGLFCALMIFLMVSTDASYIHSWGSIFIQDVVLPLRKKPFEPKTQLLLLRMAAVGIAIFAWFFSFYFGQVTYILMFFAITGTIYLGGAGAAILGGLYWRNGTNIGAWTAMLTGMFLGVGGFLVQKYWHTIIYPVWANYHSVSLLSFKNGLEWLGNKLPFVYWEVTPERFPISGQEMYFLTMLAAFVAYVIVSIITCKENYNLDRMLHRGKYARKEDMTEVREQQGSKFLKIVLGIDKDYSRGDRILAWSVFIYSTYQFLFTIFLFGWHLLISPISEKGYFYIWAYYSVPLSFLIGAITTVWFTIGGSMDLYKLFKALNIIKRSNLDDGRVIGHVSADDIALVEEADQTSIPEAHKNESRADKNKS